MAAMERDHSSDSPFEATNSSVKRTTTPRAERAYVVNGRAGEEVPEVRNVESHNKRPSHVSDATEGRAGWTLANFWQQPEPQQAGMMLEEVAGIRLYTGPMYVVYNAVLRGLRTQSDFLKNSMVTLCCPKDVTALFMGDAKLWEPAKGSITLDEVMLSLTRYTTTLHAINSGIIKLSKLTKATTVYRGVTGLLPDDFWEPNEHDIMGGVELGFMSTSRNKEVALGYMRQNTESTAKVLLQIRMGMIDRGADVSCLSQFPHEREILFAPLTGLEVIAMPRDEQGVLIVELGLSCNLQNQTLEQVVGKRQTSHLGLIDAMIDDLRLGIVGLPPLVLKPLEDVKADVQARKHTFFNKPQQYLTATAEALKANDACYTLLADEVTWKSVDGDGDAVVAVRMRDAARKCAKEDRPKEAAALLVIAVNRAGVPSENRDLVAQILSAQRPPAADGRAALEASSLLLATQGTERGVWASALLELGALCGDRHSVG
eukprot:457517-Prymnesium_polylepis.1